MKKESKTSQEAPCFNYDIEIPVHYCKQDALPVHLKTDERGIGAVKFKSPSYTGVSKLVAIPINVNGYQRKKAEQKAARAVCSWLEQAEIRLKSPGYLKRQER